MCWVVSSLLWTLKRLTSRELFTFAFQHTCTGWHIQSSSQSAYRSVLTCAAGTKRCWLEWRTLPRGLRRLPTGWKGWAQTGTTACGTPRRTAPGGCYQMGWWSAGQRRPPGRRRRSARVSSEGSNSSPGEGRGEFARLAVVKSRSWLVYLSIKTCAAPPPSWRELLRSGLRKQQTLRPQTQRREPEGTKQTHLSWLLNTAGYHNNTIFCLTSSPSPLVSWPRSCCTWGRGRRRCSHSSRPRGPGGPPSPGWGRTPQPAPEWWSWSSGSTCLGSPGWWTRSGWSWSTEGRRLNRKSS